MDDRQYLLMAFQEAEQAARERTYPIGAVIVGPDGQVVSRGRNRVCSAGDITGHAEIEAIRNAGWKLSEPDLSERCTIYTTVEPCLMCTGAILLAHIHRIVWAMDDHLAGAVRTLRTGPYRPHKFARLDLAMAPDPELEARQRALMVAWERSRDRDPSCWLLPAP